MTMFERFDRHATLGRGLVLRALSFGLMAWFMMAWMPSFLARSGGLLPLDARFTYGPDEASRLVDALGPEGRTFYLRMLATDVALMATVLLGDLMLLGLLVRRVGVPDLPRRVLIAGIAADAIENVVTASVLLGGPVVLFRLGGAATLVKQLAGIGVVVSYLGALGILGIRAARAAIAR